MVTSCSAWGCTNRVDKQIERSFHRFPLKDESLTMQWVAASMRNGSVPTKNSVLCSDHFEKGCFYPSVTRHKQLREGTIPTIFKFPGRLQERKASKGVQRKVSRVERCPSPFVEAIPFVEAVYDEDAVTNSIQHAIDLDHSTCYKPTAETPTTETLLAKEREKNAVLTRKLKHCRAMSRQQLKLICELTESLSELKKQTNGASDDAPAIL